MAFNRCTFHYSSFHKINTLNSFTRNVNVNVAGFSKKATCQFVIVTAAAVGRSHTMSLPLVYIFITVRFVLWMILKKYKYKIHA